MKVCRDSIPYVNWRKGFVLVFLTPLLFISIEANGAAAQDRRECITCSPESRRIAAELVDAIGERLAIAISVAAAKRVTGAAIDDPVREAQAAQAFIDLVSPAGVSEADARVFIQTQFDASKFIQATLIRQWNERPETIPSGEPPNLVTQVRPALDSITQRLARAYTDAWTLSQKSPLRWFRVISPYQDNPAGMWRWQRLAEQQALSAL